MVVILFMDKILHQLIGGLSDYLQGFIHTRRLFGISKPSTVLYGCTVVPNHTQSCMLISCRFNKKQQTCRWLKNGHENPKLPPNEWEFFALIFLDEILQDPGGKFIVMNPNQGILVS